MANFGSQSLKNFSTNLKECVQQKKIVLVYDGYFYELGWQTRKELRTKNANKNRPKTAPHAE